VHQRAEQPVGRLAELIHQVLAAIATMNGLAGGGENPFDLFVKLVAIGNYGHPGIWLVLQNPLN
jgi:hypothetical protein